MWCFLKPKNIGFEDQIETSPHSFQGIILARYLAMGGGNFSILLHVLSPEMFFPFWLHNATFQMEINEMNQFLIQKYTWAPSFFKQIYI